MPSVARVSGPAALTEACSQCGHTWGHHRLHPAVYPYPTDGWRITCPVPACMSAGRTGAVGCASWTRSISSERSARKRFCAEMATCGFDLMSVGTIRLPRPPNGGPQTSMNARRRSLSRARGCQRSIVVADPTNECNTLLALFRVRLVDEQRCLSRLRRVGLDRCAGYLTSVGPDECATEAAAVPTDLTRCPCRSILALGDDRIPQAGCTHDVAFAPVLRAGSPLGVALAHHDTRGRSRGLVRRYGKRRRRQRTRGASRVAPALVGAHARRIGRATRPARRLSGRVETSAALSSSGCYPAQTRGRPHRTPPNVVAGKRPLDAAVPLMLPSQPTFGVRPHTT
jgi:hypothetical protein